MFIRIRMILLNINLLEWCKATKFHLIPQHCLIILVTVLELLCLPYYFALSFCPMSHEQSLLYENADLLEMHEVVQL